MDTNNFGSAVIEEIKNLDFALDASGDADELDIVSDRLETIKDELEIAIRFTVGHGGIFYSLNADLLNMQYEVCRLLKRADAYRETMIEEATYGTMEQQARADYYDSVL